MMPFSRSTCLIIRPVTSEMRVPVSRHVSQIRRFGSSSRASTCAVCSGERMRFSKTSHFLGSFTRWIGLAYVRGMISHSVAFVMTPLMALRRAHIACQDVQTSWSQSMISLALKSLRRVSFHRGRM